MAKILDLKNKKECLKFIEDVSNGAVFAYPTEAVFGLGCDINNKSSINKIIQGLQDASQSGATNLPTRDIPIMTEQIMHDNSARPNFVPSPAAEKANYIQDEETMETLINQKKKKLLTV